MLVGMRTSICVRPLQDAEQQALSVGQRSPDAFVLRRCQILLSSARGERAPRIAEAALRDPAVQTDPLRSETLRALLALDDDV